MTLDEYESDLKYLFKKFDLSETEGQKFLDIYLKAKEYSNDQLNLLISIADDQYSQMQLEKHLKYLNQGPEEYISGPPEDEMVKNKAPLKDDYALIVSLYRRLKSVPYPFKEINPRYLKSPEKSKEFEEAEKWMLRNGYFREDGSWNNDLHRKDLITFLNLLIVAGILKYSTEKDMNAYFSSRYKTEPFGSYLKLSKLKSHNKFGEFEFLARLLGYKIKED